MKGSRVVLLHGFGQDHRCWGPLGDALAREHDVVALDLPGHGGAGAVHADLPTTGQLVIDAADGPASIVGYSMGGRIALHAALDRPDLVASLVLISATAGIDDEAEREARRASDEALADRIEEIGVEAFADEWLALPLFAGLPPEHRFVEERRSNRPAGLAMSLRLAGTGTQVPLWNRLHELTMPVLLIAGAEDAKFTALAERMAGCIGDNAHLAVIGGAGHSVHLEQPVATTELIVAWLDRTEPDQTK
jgi:2-succinyl-6-hydroxy-2,4-cyclohexadiene-1-carboxylate synthase